MNKRALLIAFHFPPQAGSSGIQRTLSFSKLLGRHGWEPMVLSAHPRAYDVQNPTQLAAIPPELVVRRPFALDTKRHLGFKGRYIDALALPDRFVSWTFGAIPTGLAMIRRYKPQVLWSTFPVATAHLIALSLHRLTGLPWIADFRDPMLQPSHPTSRRQRAIFGWIERQTIARCRFAVLTTESARRAYQARFPQVDPAKFVVIENGYDEEEFGRLLAQAATAAAPAAAGAAARRVTLLHSGVLYDAGRNPESFLAALAALKSAGKVDAASLRIVLRAPGNLPAARAKVERHGVGDIVEILPPVPYREALGEMLAADGLLLFQGTPFNNQIPAKVYEYFRTRKPILGLVDPEGETAQVLRAAGFELSAQVDQPEEISTALERFIPGLRDGTAYVASDEVIAQAARTHKAAQLARLFDEAVQ
ncbi:glycosyltransferase [Massilia brevitalea]|uniref:glycosyltransferase n=1 Tax=Massilia brevitalea TaxID=442526 RepID=UPI002739B6DC|nr:glycosyltransferase [Massilia brevitalea]